MNKHTIYVYGTLRPGLNRDIVLVPGVMYDLGGFPGAVLLSSTPDTRLCTIVCERVEVGDEGLQRLDQLEGYDPDRSENENFYLRVPIFGDGWIYVFNNLDRYSCSADSVIHGGDWLAYKGQSKGHNCHLLEQR